MSGFDHLQFWHWFILAAIFAGIEMLTPGFFFIWLGGAALVIGLVALVFSSMSWEVQLILFAALSGLSVLGWYKFGRKLTIATDDTNLNRRGDSLIGRTGQLSEPIVNGRGRVKIDDSVWSAEGDDAPDGAKVLVTGVRDKRPEGSEIVPRIVNGSWGYVVYVGDQAVQANHFEFDGDRIIAVHIVRNPDKLQHLARG